MSGAPWETTVALPERTTWLLEASAGTGKTFQIAGLFVRLVAECDVPVDRILAITFTNAATAELRDRIRKRLRDALGVLRREREPDGDPVFTHLLGLDRREHMETNLERALRSFDLAPISTIHGFSQRMLQELAFDSGQDPELELLADATEILEEIVEDALATLYADVSVAELALFEEACFDRKNLLAVARAMSGPIAPRVSPAGTGDLEAQRRRASEWIAATRAMRELWGSDGERAVEQLVEDVRNRRFSGWRASWVESSAAKLEGWLATGAAAIDKAESWYARFAPAGLREGWKGGGSAIDTRPWWPFFEKLDAFSNAHDRFWLGFAPLAAFATSVRPRVEAELARRRALTFDGMLSRLAERIAADGGASSELAGRIRERFDAAFVDEFQDTDDAQWRVIEAAFLGHRRLFLIGDPKQAIYGFRGADVHVYLKAARRVDDATRRTMVDNWRSDEQVVRAMNALFRPGSRAFDEADIDYVEVGPQRPDRLAPKLPGLEVRWVDARVAGGAAGEPIPWKATALAARLAAGEVVAWLRRDRARIVEAKGDERRERDAEPADLAVLVASHHEAESMRHALRRVRVPAVAASKDSVFETPVAGWLASWLDAVAGGGRDRDARTAVVSPLFGWTADELAWALAIADGGDEVREAARAASATVRDWDAWTARLRAAAERWPREGFARTFDLEANELGLLPRLLAMPDGERHATDLRHLFELLHVEERTRRSGPAGLAAWLREQASAATDEHGQRLESDARAVRIETVHASKGLEYPVVLLPFAWSARREDDKGGPLAVRASDGATLDVSVRGTPARAAARGLACDEERREGLRRAYVALTRAKHLTVAWYGPIGAEGKKACATPYGRLLLRDPARPGFDDDTMPDFSALPAAWASARARLEAMVARSAGTIAWTEVEAPSGADDGWNGRADAASAELAVATWPGSRGPIAGPWKVTSFTALAPGSAMRDTDEKVAADDAIAAGGAHDDRASEPGSPAPSFAEPALSPFPALPRLERGGGTSYGTWVHKVLELTDFRTRAPKPGRNADVLVAEALRVGYAKHDPAVVELGELLPDILATPLDADRDDELGLAQGFSLAQLDARDRLDELRFDLRLGDGTAWRREERSVGARAPLDPRAGCVDPAAVYDAILSAKGARGRAFEAWLASLEKRRAAGLPLIGAMPGILTGSIDLVFRTGGGQRSHFLVDYKTNLVGAAPGHYAHAWLDRKMAMSNYYLQSLLYTIALHRHLRARVPDYRYDAHVGGWLYLFLRGMSGPATPRDPESGRCLGVLGGRWPEHVVEALDAALSPAEGTR